MSILSIQSHVSYGYVGNAAGVFILQRMGYDVWPVHTVMFSNHPGYGSYKGNVIDKELMADILSGIGERGAFSRCQAVIGGYIGAASSGDVMTDAVLSVKQANPDCLFFCDPVMGDRDKGLYVNDDIVRFYRERGGPATDVLKPNAFELEVLASQPVVDIEQAVDAASKLIRQWSLSAVVVSSVPVPIAGKPGSHPETIRDIACVAVTNDQAWVVKTPLLPVEQKGAGDAFMALFVAGFLESGGDLSPSLGGAASSIWSIMNRSISTADQELQLIQGQEEFSNPSRSFAVQEINL